MNTLEGLGMQESDLIMVAMTRYLLALDELYDQQAAELRRCIHRAEEAGRSLHVQLAKLKLKQQKPGVAS